MVFTASFKIIKKLDNYCQLAVSSGLPSWYNGGRYRKLAPSYEFVKLLKAAQKEGTISEDKIEKFTAMYYQQTLSKLDPQTVYNELQERSQGFNVVLLSHEASDEFSIRYILKAWFESAGIPCEEIT